MTPLLSASGTIVMRRMKKFHYSVVSFYLNICIGVGSGVIILITNIDMSLMKELKKEVWLLIVVNGFTCVA